MWQVTSPSRTPQLRLRARSIGASPPHSGRRYSLGPRSNQKHLAAQYGISIRSVQRPIHALLMLSGQIEEHLRDDVRIDVIPLSAGHSNYPLLPVT